MAKDRIRRRKNINSYQETTVWCEGDARHCAWITGTVYRHPPRDHALVSSRKAMVVEGVKIAPVRVPTAQRQTFLQEVHTS